METQTKKIIDDWIAESRKGKEKVKITWWPTDLGKCLSGVYYARQGLPADEKFDERTLRVFEIGHVFEEWVVEKVRALHPTAVPQVRLLLPEHNLSGYGDLYLPEMGVLKEYKTIHSRAFNYGLPKHEHKLQLMAGLLALNCPIGHLCYMSKDDLRIDEFVVSLDDYSLKEEVFGILSTLNKAWEAQIPPEPVPTFDKTKGGNWKIHWKAEYCSHHSHCLQDKDWKKKALKEIRKLNK